MVGARIRELRIGKGLTQLELATAAGVDKMTLSRIELGTCKPLFETAVALAAALGVGIAQLVKPPTIVHEVKLGRPFKRAEG